MRSTIKYPESRKKISSSGGYLRGAAHPQIPALLYGVRTQVLEGARFRAY
jgi:hypothetical protein